MSWRHFFIGISFTVLGLSSCTSPLQRQTDARRVIADALAREDCPRADQLAQEFSRSNAPAQEVDAVCAHVNAMCASAALGRENFAEATNRAHQALRCQPGESLAQYVLTQVREKQNEQGLRSAIADALVREDCPRADQLAQKFFRLNVPQQEVDAVCARVNARCADAALNRENFAEATDRANRSLQCQPGNRPAISVLAQIEKRQESHRPPTDENPVAVLPEGEGNRGIPSPPSEGKDKPVDPMDDQRQQDLAFVEKILSSKYEDLPGPFERFSEGGREPELSISNDSPYELTVVIQQRDHFSKRTILQPGATSTIELPAGTYEIAAQINSPNVLHFSGEHSYEKGKGYSLQFVVVVDPDNLG